MRDLVEVQGLISDEDLDDMLDQLDLTVLEDRQEEQVGIKEDQAEVRGDLHEEVREGRKRDGLALLKRDKYLIGH